MPIDPSPARGLLIDPNAPDDAPRWREQPIPACARCGILHDPRDHDGEHRHAYPRALEPCSCGEPFPRPIRWPWAAGAYLETGTVKAIATGNLELADAPRYRLLGLCNRR